MSNPASPSQTLREQIEQEVADLESCCAYEHPCPAEDRCAYCSGAHMLTQAADRLASLEQRNADLEQWQQSAEAIAREFMDDGSSFGPDEYRTVSIGDVAALVLPFQAQVASLEQAQQALREENEVLAEQVRRAFEVLRITHPRPTADRNAKEGAESL